MSLFQDSLLQPANAKQERSLTKLLMATEAAPLASAEDYNGLDEEKWWTENTVAVVAGSSRGIGLETVRHLAKQGLTVVLTARNDAHGLAIAKSVVDEGYPNVHFHQLDVQSDQSVLLLADWIQNKFGGIDILINNAAVIGAKIDWDLWESRGISRLGLLANRSFIEGFSEDYNSGKACLDINYFGAKRMVKALLPLLKPSSCGSRIVNVSSLGGLLQHLGNETLRMQLDDVENLNEETIDGFTDMYLNDEKSGEIEGKGWPARLRAYIVSKIALNAYTRFLARDLQSHDHKVYVNCLHPGSFVKTDMTGQGGDMSAAEAAAYAARVALLPPGGPSGQFFDKEKLLTSF